MSAKSKRDERNDEAYEAFKAIKPLPPKHSDEAHKAALLVLAVDHAHDILPVCEDEREQTEGTFNAQSIAYLISGCDEHGNDRTEESWDAVETLAYQLLCAHYGFETETK